MATYNLVSYHPGPPAQQTATIYKQFQRVRPFHPPSLNNLQTSSSMHRPTRVASRLNLQAQTPLSAVPSSFGSVSSYDNGYFDALPGTADGDFSAPEFFPWRESAVGQPFVNQFLAPADDRVALDAEPSNGVPPVPGNPLSGPVWTSNTAHSSNFSAFGQQHAIDGSSAFHSRPAARGYHSGDTIGIASASLASHASYACGPPLLTVPVDASEFEKIEDAHWAYVVTDYDDNAPSPASIDTHSSGPRTPVSPQHSSSLALTHTHGGPTYEVTSFDSAIPKVETSFGAFPASNMPATMNAQPHTAPTVASFGNMTLAGAFSSQPGLWPTTAPPSQGACYTHPHGLPAAGPGLFSNDDLYHGVQPAAVQPVFHRPEPDVFEDFGHSHLENSPDVYSESESEVEPDEKLEEDMNDRALHDAQARRDRDKYLLKMRNEGLSYKEIKRRGNFREAESTLRGRVRVLTKHKADRVRRPEWAEDDLRLLDRAIDRFSGTHGHGHGRGRDGGRLPWKKISEYLVKNGSSYHFAAATCARKWKEMKSSM